MDPLILNLGTKWEVSGQLHVAEVQPVGPTESEVMWVPKTVWIVERREKFLSLLGIEP
jgi:hypothetical protein